MSNLLAELLALLLLHYDFNNLNCCCLFVVVFNIWLDKLKKEISEMEDLIAAANVCYKCSCLIHIYHFIITVCNVQFKNIFKK